MASYIYRYPDAVKIETPCTVGQAREKFGHALGIVITAAAYSHKGELKFTNRRGFIVPHPVDSPPTAVDDSYVIQDNEWVEFCNPIGPKGANR